MGIVEGISKHPVRAFIFTFAIIFLLLPGIISLFRGGWSCDDASRGAFTNSERDLCKTEDGRLIVHYFGMRGCQHCEFLKEPFRTASGIFANKSLIEVHDWGELNESTKLTPEDAAIFDNFSNGHSVPTIVIGCRYYRIGAPFEHCRIGAKLEIKSITSAICNALPEGEPACAEPEPRPSSNATG